MDCCNYGQARAQSAAGAAWPYAGYYHHPAPPDHFARHYRYHTYPPPHHPDHAVPQDYGAYSMKDVRARRSLSRREQRVHPALHFPLAHTPPLDCGVGGRGYNYCEPQMWPQYQMGLLGGNGWNGANTVGGMWAPHNLCSREQMRYPSDYRLLKTPQNHVGSHDGRSTPYPVYDQAAYNSETEAKRVPEYSTRKIPKETKSVRDTALREHHKPPEEKRPIVPLPAFQQAFGSTEIGKFAEAFSRAEVAQEADESCENFLYDSFNEWDGSLDAQWSQANPKEIKCEDSF
ncbi:uncharacterized protein LOC126976949 [Leptidea sinapis]|uniref:uncharacterized protein LOC126976949 n=1 Tax=Leptidea sinapis TaxID=189913 RepID=UPI002138B124|nr:uncharacterized protein LOC126976949 [Leptidea sinapis]